MCIVFAAVCECYLFAKSSKNVLNHIMSTSSMSLTIVQLKNGNNQKCLDNQRHVHDIMMPCYC